MEDRVAQRTAELAAAKKQAEAANNSKTRFLANVSHELRTPLNVILGFTQVILADQHLSFKHQDAFRHIHQNGQSLLTLIRAISQVTQLEKDISEYNVCFNLPELLETLYNQLQPQAAAKQLQFTIQPLTELPCFICTDESKLRDVLINLSDNAINSLSQGLVSIRIWAHSNEVGSQGEYHPWTLRVEIEHSSGGSSPLRTAEATQNFVPVPPEYNLDQGVGLGVYVSREYVRSMGGKLTYQVFSGWKTVFRFVIPIKSIVSLQEQTTRSPSSLVSQLEGATKYGESLTRERSSSLAYALSKMPRNWLRDLEQAALRGADAELDKLIAEIPSEYSELSSFLKSQNLNFQFDSILEIVNSIRHEINF